MYNAETALIVVDLQRDFLPGGALEVPNGDLILPYIEELAREFETRVLTLDWHPANHTSFVEQGGPWPAHCVQFTRGAEVAAADVNPIMVIAKGWRQNLDSYSGFYENDHTTPTGLDGYLFQRGITHLHIVGLATEYCVKYTVLDALDLGYNVVVHGEGIKGLNEESEADATLEMMREGAVFV